jgi:hypothetical protein
MAAQTEDKKLDGSGLSILWGLIKSLVGGKSDKTSTVSTVGYDTTNKKITKTINGITTDVVTASDIVTDGNGVKTDDSRLSDSRPANGGNSATVNNHSVNKDVPSDAKFTDTTYESKPATSDGTDVSLVTTGEKFNWNYKQDNIVNGAEIGSGFCDCSTDATVAAKTVTLENYVMVPNIPLSIRFRNAINCADATLSINSLPAKPLYIGGNKLQPGVVKTNNTVTVVYDGTKFNIVCISGLEQSSSPSDLFVDMGLPSGLLWAKKNIDITQADGFAASEYQYECTFFSWGNTQGRNPVDAGGFDYTWSEANYNLTSGAVLNGSVAPSMDCARANLGSPWRLPTRSNFVELFNSEYTKFIDANGDDIAAGVTDKLITMNNIKGVRLMSKSNNNILFLPCVGETWESYWSSKGSLACYWSSTYINYHDARMLYISNSEVNTSGIYGRSTGLPIRPVQ